MEWLQDALASAAYVGVAAAIFVIAKLVNDWTTPYRIDHELMEKDNPALGVSILGYLLGVGLVLGGVLMGPSRGLGQDLIDIAMYGLLGVVLLNLSRVLNDRLILGRFSNVKEIIEDRNVGTGAVQAGSYIASGLVVAGAVSGQGGGVVTALAFFGLGQACLVIFGLLYERLVPYDLHKEIEADNVAAGVAFGGALLALGIILAKAAGGNFFSWGENLTRFGFTVLVGLILLPLGRFFLEWVLFRSSNLAKEIAEDRNINAGFIELAVLSSFSIIVVISI
ncbi:MAG: DUF350 domain-containing protein [Planctomycetota bacterium]